jgi:DNA (cytosine-5)-methyltransferase 1
MNVQLKHQKKKVLSLFSGCGGMDLGFEGNFKVHRSLINPKIHPDWIQDSSANWVTLPETFFETVFANDILDAAAKAYMGYFHGKRMSNAEYVLESVVELVKRHDAGEMHVFPEVDVVTGGFPCQDFSVAGKRLGFDSHKGHHGGMLTFTDEPTEENRGKLYVWMRRVVEITQPKLFVAENVKGLVTLADVKRIIEQDFRSIGGAGYLVVEAKVLRAYEYGVPQSRERVIFIGLRKDLLTPEAIVGLMEEKYTTEWDLYPKKTHASIQNEWQLPFPSSSEVLLDLPEPHDSDDLAHQSFSKAKWYGKHVQGQTEVNLSGLGPTIRAEHHGNIEFRRLSIEHGGKNLNELSLGLKERRLSVRECARIQTFPDDYEFVTRKGTGRFGSLSASEGYKVIGNAVPPLLAYHIATRLQVMWHKLFKD